jgi:hypothetical protein
MSKLSNLLLCSAVSIGLAACASAPPAKPKVADCTYFGTQDPAPAWICGAPVDGVDVSAVGSAESSGAGEAFMRQMAMTDARVQLAQMTQVHVANMIKQYAETTGAGKDETVDKVNTSVTKQITDAKLVGSKMYRSQSGTNGRYYVLVGIDAASSQKITEAAIKTSMNNEKALWQKFQAGKAQDELAADIAKQKVEAAAAGATK